MYDYKVTLICDQTDFLHSIIVSIPRRSFDAAARAASKKIHTSYKRTPFTFSVKDVHFIA